MESCKRVLSNIKNLSVNYNIDDNSFYHYSRAITLSIGTQKKDISDDLDKCMLFLAKELKEK